MFTMLMLVATIASADVIPIERMMLKRCGLVPIEEMTVNTNTTVVRVWISDSNSQFMRIHHLVASGDKLVSWQYFCVRVRADQPPAVTLDLSNNGQTAWAKLHALGILTLPDQAKVDFPMPYDAARYSVRVLQGGTVRTYSYYAPDVVPRSDDKAFAEITKILQTEVKRERSNQPARR